jgi:uncharacterized membrane protein YgcG
MRRWIAFAFLLGTMLTLLTVSAQSRSVFWKRWDVLVDQVDVNTNQFRVTETYDIDFSGTFRFGSAVIPMNNLEDIKAVEVFEEGRPLQASCSGKEGTYCVERASDGLSITYYFSRPITDSSAVFILRYTVIGALRIYQGGDQLWWIAVPSEHYGFPIGSSTITVQMPVGYAPREGIDPIETYGVPSTIEVRGTTIVARANRQIVGDESFEIRVQYPHNPAARIPSWQQTFDQQRQYDETTRPLIDLGAVALSLLLGVGGTMGVYALWYTRGRDPKVGPVPEYLTTPPSTLSPAVVGALLDEKADLRDILATLIDLAHRGYLVIEEKKTEGQFFGLSSRSGFTFKRTDQPITDLAPHEKRLVDSLFKGRLERSLDSLRNNFYLLIPTLQNDLYDALVREGLFTTNPNQTRAMWSGLTVILVALAFLGGFGLISMMEDNVGVLLCLPGALLGVGVLAMIVSQHMPAKTRKGAEEAAKWRAFREYLANLEKYSDVETVAPLFDQYLPYAVAFGLDRSWVRRFSRIPNTPIPSWYYPVYLGGPYHGGYAAGTSLHRPSFGGLTSGSTHLPGELAQAPGHGLSLDNLSGGISSGLENISSGLSSLLDSAARTMTSTPPQSSSSGRWSSGGRSWSGGGFRSGGGSGGGRRGFG